MFIIGILLNTSEVGILAPIVVVMLPVALIMKRRLAAFERKAGSPFLNGFIVPLQKKNQLIKCKVNI